MDLNQVYDELCQMNVTNFGDSVKVRNGFFRKDDLIDVFGSGLYELYLKLDKSSVIEVMNNILPKINLQTKKDSYEYMIDIFYLVQDEINNYFGESKENTRLQFYMLNGTQTNDDEYMRVYTISQIKGLGLAQCAEKASLANNILLMLNHMGLFEYKVNYLNSLLSINGSLPGGHAFLEFSRIKTNGELSHYIFDVTNPEIVTVDDKNYNYPAIYCLTEDEYTTFLNGGKFDNSKFVRSHYYQVKRKREYMGFQKSNNYEVKNTDKGYNSSNDSSTNNVILPDKDNIGIHR